MRHLLLLTLSIHGSFLYADEFHLDIAGKNVPKLDSKGDLNVDYLPSHTRTPEDQLRYATLLTMTRTKALRFSISKMKAGLNPRSDPKPKVRWDTHIVANDLSQNIKDLESELSGSLKIAPSDLSLAKTALADGKLILDELSKLPPNVRALEVDPSQDK